MKAMCRNVSCFLECTPHYPPSVTSDNLAFQDWRANSWPLKKKKSLCVAEIGCDYLMLLPKQVGSLPPSLSTEYPSLRELSFLGGGRQFLASDSWLEASEKSLNPFIGKGWVISFSSGLLGVSLYSWLPKTML